MNNETKNLRLEKSEDLLSKAVFAIDTDGTICWTNQVFRTLCGYSKKEILGKTVEEFFLDDQTEAESARALRVAVASGSHLTAEFLNHHKKGHPYWVSIELTPTKNKRGCFSGFIVVERDVTEEHAHVAAIERQVSQTYSALLSVEESNRKPKIGI